MNNNENEKPCATQCAQILAWMRKGNTITALEALNMFGCMRLASRIHDLREHGFEIQKERIQVPSGKYVVQYSINQ